ncbi:MAG TPA: hypothetical protein VFQ45_09240 [Longimicrobium sp.]|nr:hypothetical protein [Longimicrobium sp.]
MLFPTRSTLRAAGLAVVAAAALLGACNDLPTPSAPATIRAEGPSALYLTDCAVLHPSFSPGYVQGRDVNLELNDYGRILYDADSPLYPECVDQASRALEVKLNAVLTDPAHFSSFLRGALVALIFAAADQIHARGGMTAGLDYQLTRVESAFAHTDVGDGCALQSTDNCMDGAAVSASAYGMIAAYRHARGADPTTARTNTRTYIAQTFTEACIHAGWNQATLCKTPATAVTAGDSTLSLNLGHRYPAYGFGLLTSVAAAVWGYDHSGAAYDFAAHEKLIATALFREMQKTVNNGVFRTDCPVVAFQNGAWRDVGDAACAGSANYRPSDYALAEFFRDKLIPIPSNGYTSEAFDWNGFIRDDFFSFGRYMTYGELAHGWWLQARPHTVRTDWYLPAGGVEGIDAGRVVRGWACDADAPTGTVRVTVSAPGKAPITRRAALGSEQWINNNCGGGTAHRFSIQLPQDWAGYTASVSVMDFFGTRTAALSCPSCVVPGSAATVTVEWVHPSGVTWGPANTLTAAGYARNGSGTVRMEWREVTFNPNAAWNVVGWQGTPDPGNGGWSNTLPSDNYCRTYQVRAVYSGVTSAVYTFNGSTAGYCSVRLIWVQPAERAGIGAPGSLVAAGEAQGAGAGATTVLWWRDITANGPWIRDDYQAGMDPNNIFLNDTYTIDPYHLYEVWVDYDVVSHSCIYQGNNDITWC